MRREVSLTVRDDEAGLRLDTYLRNRLRALSRTQIQGLIETELVAQALKPSSLVRTGQRLVFECEVPDELPPPKLSILYQDDSLVVVDKPGDLAVHPAGRYHLYTVTSALALLHQPRPDPAHRLDRETSGLLLCGRGRAAASALKLSFAEGRVSKTYLAFVEGWPESTHFRSELPLALGSGQVRVKMEVGTGKAATTHFELARRLIDRDGNRFAQVICRPVTGRQHQIRAHLAATGFPIVGDKIYGPDETIFIRFTEGRMSPTDLQRLRIARQALHAAAIRFPHPQTGTEMQLESPLPADLLTFQATLEEIV